MATRNDSGSCSRVNLASRLVRLLVFLIGAVLWLSITGALPGLLRAGIRSPCPRAAGPYFDLRASLSRCTSDSFSRWAFSRTASLSPSQVVWRTIHASLSTSCSRAPQLHRQGSRHASRWTSG